MKRVVAGCAVAAGFAALLTGLWAWRNNVKERLMTLRDQQTQIRNFHRMYEVFPSRVIHHDESATFRFARDLQGVDITYTFQGKQLRLEEFLERTTTMGLLVIKDDRIVLERYFRGADGASLFTSWSVAKSFVSALIGVAIHEGIIAGVDRPITDYVPELRGSGYDGATIKDVLQMSSGVDFNEVYDNLFSNISRMYLGSFLFGTRINDYAAGVSSRSRPGEKFEYVSVDTQALGMLLERATGKHLAAYLEEKLWRPLGMESDAYWITDRSGDSGMEYAFCCLNATLRDYAKFGRLYLHGGDWNGRQIVPDSWVRESVVPDKPFLRLSGADTPWWAPPGWDIGYQYQWWVPAGQDGEFTAIGLWGQYVYVNPRENVVIVKTSVDPDFDRDMETIAAFRGICAALREKK